MRIVIMVAMEEEAQYLRPLLGEVRTIDMPGVYGDTATRGVIGDAEVFPCHRTPSLDSRPPH